MDKKIEEAASIIKLGCEPNFRHTNESCTIVYGAIQTLRECEEVDQNVLSQLATITEPDHSHSLESCVVAINGLNNLFLKEEPLD